MARGDLYVFDEAKAHMIDGGFEPADVLKCAILDNTLAPTVADAIPALGLYTEVGSGGTYVAGGESLGALGDAVTEAGGVMKFDSAVDPTWALNAGNDTDAYWGLIYNSTDVGKRAFAYVDLGGPVDMQAGDLTVTWNAAGIFTIT